MTLQELTGQESGIILYTDGDNAPSLGVFNWSRCNDDEVPVAFMQMDSMWHFPGIFDEVEQTEVPSVLGFLERYPNAGVVYDRWDDIGAVKTGGADVNAACFRLGYGIIVLAPDGWN